MTFLLGYDFYFLINWVIASSFFGCLSLFCFKWSSFYKKGVWVNLYKLTFFIFSLFHSQPKKRREIKIFLSSHFSTLPTKRTLKEKIKPSIIHYRCAYLLLSCVCAYVLLFFSFHICIKLDFNLWGKKTNNKSYLGILGFGSGVIKGAHKNGYRLYQGVIS